MKTASKTILLLAFLSALASGCADSNFMDKTQVVSNLIKGEKVQAGSPLSKSVVLIAQQLEVKKDSVNIFGICSGAVIGPRTILTAAHCVESGTEKMRVILDVNPRFQLLAKNIYRVVDAVTHPDYKSLSEVLSREEIKQNADLAVLQLDRDIEFGEPALLATQKDFQVQKSLINVTLTGFGRTTALSDTSNLSFAELNGQLKKANLLISNDKLKLKYFEIEQRETSGICNGDSGAPVFVNKDKKSYLFAVAVGTYRENNSEESELEQNKYTNCAGFGVFVNLEGHMDWILDTMKTLGFRN